MAEAEAGDSEDTQAVDYGVRHAAIIMDGNGRWAKKRHLPRAMGHRAGVEAVRKTVRAARHLGLEALTLYAFSSENWKRPEEEVSDLMGLLRHYIRNDIDELVANNVRLHVIGNYRVLAPDIVAMIDDVLERTADNDGTILAVALNYGGQDEIVRAARAVAAEVARGDVDPGTIAAEHIDAALDTATLPPLDLIIRTSGERRLSNFLLWQSAYAELYFTDTLWPDFSGDHLREALDDFRGRDRRFGGR
ncbi:MAG: isoprenyl transferase [Pseudomonadota bacterium]